MRAAIGNKIRHFLNLDPSALTLFYKAHNQSIKDGSTMKNAEGFKFIKYPTARQPRVSYPRAAFEGGYRDGGARSSYQKYVRK